MYPVVYCVNQSANAIVIVQRCDGLQVCCDLLSLELGEVIVFKTVNVFPNQERIDVLR